VVMTIFGIKIEILFSALAVGISAIHLIVYIIYKCNEKAKIRAESKLYNADTETPWLNVKVVNVGKRSALICLVGGKTDDGAWSAHTVDNEGKGVWLKPNEKHEIDFKRNDLFCMDMETRKDIGYLSLWIEDSRGVRHPVKDSVKNIKELLALTE